MPPRGSDWVEPQGAIVRPHTPAPPAARSFQYEENVNDLFDWAGRKFGEGLHKTG